MRQGFKRQSCLLAGLSLALLATTWPAQAYSSFFGFLAGDEPPAPAAEAPVKKVKKIRSIKAAGAEKAEAAGIVIPPGPLHIIVSIASQRATLYADGKEVAQTPVSTGTPGHPTPMGVFTVIQKDRHHVSNLYGAPMPYMQRITWSGTALHTGPLPGRPASHGCIRLTNDFAMLLWKATKLGARVIVTRNDVIPVDVDSPRLFTPKPKGEAATAARIKTADASNAIPNAAAAAAQGPAETTGTAKPADAAAATQPPALAAPNLVAAPKALPSLNGPVSVFISRKAAKIYVRQAQRPLFEMPVTIMSPDQPLGTHVYTAMEVKDGGAALRWTAVSIPSSYPRAAEPKRHDGKKKRAGETVGQAATVADEPLPSASAALERIEIPKEAVERIADLMSPGSSLIVSDNGISDETGQSTDFIVLTR